MNSRASSNAFTSFITQERSVTQVSVLTLCISGIASLLLFTSLLASDDVRIVMSVLTLVTLVVLMIVHGVLLYAARLTI